MLRSDTLMLDNKLFPLYQERVTSLTFNTEHSSEQLWCCEEFCEESLVMTGSGRRSGKSERIKKIVFSLRINENTKHNFIRFPGLQISRCLQYKANHASSVKLCVDFTLSSVLHYTV